MLSLGISNDRVGGGILETERWPGMQLATLARPTCQETFMTGSPVAGETLGAMFRKIKAQVRERNAQIVSLEVFGIKAAAGWPCLCEAIGKPTFPITWIEEGCEERNPLAGAQVWAVSGAAVKPLCVGDHVVGSVFSDGGARYCRMGGLAAKDLTLDSAEQARFVFDVIQANLCLAGMDFSHVARTWFYNDRMLTWYDVFNRVRTDFFNEQGVFEGLLPASTGVGGRNRSGSALTGGLLALSPLEEGARIFAVGSPQQCPARQYGSSFSRAVEIDTTDLRRLLISGTASIAPMGLSLHVGDVEAQIARTMEVIEAILGSRGMSWSQVTRSIAYFKHVQDAPALGRYAAARNLPSFPVLLVKGEICRDDLLFEIEVDAVGGICSDSEKYCHRRISAEG